jgi:hypothetical protein
MYAVMSWHTCRGFFVSFLVCVFWLLIASAFLLYVKRCVGGVRGVYNPLC